MTLLPQWTALRTHVESCNLYNYVPFSQMGTLRHAAVQ